MSEGAYSTLLFTGLIAGPAGAFLVGTHLLPIFALFPLATISTGDVKSFLRIISIGMVPAVTLGLALWSGNHRLADGSVRWLAAVASGASLSAALGSSRAAALLHGASRRMPGGGFLEGLSMVLALSGPLSGKVRDSFRSSRRAGAGLGESLTVALSGLDELQVPAPGISPQTRCVVHVGEALAAWTICLAGLAGLA